MPGAGAVHHIRLGKARGEHNESGVLQKRKSSEHSATSESVESRMGAEASAIRQRPVSHPRSSNRTCPIKASGSPTGFTVGPTGSKQTARGFGTVSDSPSPLDTAVSDGACL